MKYQNLEDEWTELWNQLINYINYYKQAKIYTPYRQINV